MSLWVLWLLILAALMILIIYSAVKLLGNKKRTEQLEPGEPDRVNSKTRDISDRLKRVKRRSPVGIKVSIEENKRI